MMASQSQLLVCAVLALAIGHSLASFTVPQAFLDRKMRAQVYKEFMKMFVSAFGPRDLAPYKEDVKSMISTMEQFLDQSPELSAIVGDIKAGEVRYYAGALRDVEAISRDDIMFLYHEHQDWKQNVSGRLQRALGMSIIDTETALDRLLLKIWGDILARVQAQQPGQPGQDEPEQRPAERD